MAMELILIFTGGNMYTHYIPEHENNASFKISFPFAYDICTSIKEDTEGIHRGYCNGVNTNIHGREHSLHSKT